MFWKEAGRVDERVLHVPSCGRERLNIGLIEINSEVIWVQHRY